MSTQAVFVGNLCRDSEVRSLQSGTSVCNNTVAVNETYTDKSGEKNKRTSYINLEAWGYRANDLGTLKKGDKVIIVATPRFVAKENERGELVFNVVEVGVCPKGDSKAPAKAAPVKGKTVAKKTKTVVVADDNEAGPEAVEEEVPF